ncbi:phasin family protein [Methylobacterium sp. NMS12]|uniref:phasin family protein n=1 Tax=Methylobacterium sp. NMS12 TaxID=3079766 RepID=UPI003F88291C
MQRPPALPLSPAVSGFGTPLRRFGIASRAAQTLGIEYLDAQEGPRRSRCHLGRAGGGPQPDRDPGGADRVPAPGRGRAAARSAAAGDAMLGLTGALLRPKAEPLAAPAPAPARPGPAR